MLDFAKWLVFALEFQSQQLQIFILYWKCLEFISSSHVKPAASIYYLFDWWMVFQSWLWTPSQNKLFPFHFVWLKNNSGETLCTLKVLDVYWNECPHLGGHGVKFLAWKWENLSIWWGCYEFTFCVTTLQICITYSSISFLLVLLPSILMDSVPFNVQ